MKIEFDPMLKSTHLSKFIIRSFIVKVNKSCECSRFYVENNKPYAFYLTAFKQVDCGEAYAGMAITDQFITDAINPSTYIGGQLNRMFKNLGESSDDGR